MPVQKRRPVPLIPSSFGWNSLIGMRKSVIKRRKKGVPHEVASLLLLCQ